LEQLFQYAESCGRWKDFDSQLEDESLWPSLPTVVKTNPSVYTKANVESPVTSEEQDDSTSTTSSNNNGYLSDNDSGTIIEYDNVNVNTVSEDWELV